MERILITGGAGYLGSVLVGHLLSRGYQVSVLDNIMYGQMSLLSYCSQKNFEFVFGDARDERIMKELIRTHDVILPFAAIVGMKACDDNPRLAESVNYEAVELLQRLRSPSQRIIYPCTNSGYGRKSGEVFCSEETPIEPISLYGITKVKAERLLLDSGSAISLRLATVFGVSLRLRTDLLVNNLVYQAVKNKFLVIFEKDFKRNYVHIDDVAASFSFCIEHFEEMKNEVYNVGLNDANLSKQELAEKIKQHIPDLYIHYAEVGSDPDKRNYVVSNEKIKRAGFIARHSLDEGIQQLIKAYEMFARCGQFNNY